MNIYVLLKRTFDTEEKITITDGRIDEDGLNSSLIHMMNMR